jgi:23S rRNA (guanine745-N1)-methyltransferase
VLYESPYENEENNFTLEGFEPAGVEKVGCDITLTKSEDIRNLLMMTPYYWKSPAEGVRRLNALETLNSRLEFEFFIFKRS